MPFVFESLRAKDAPQIAALHASCFDSAWTEKAFQSLLEKPSTVAYGVRNEKRNLLAVIVLAVVKKEGEILTICVNPSYQRQGFASKLWAHSLRHLSLNKSFLEVSIENSAALSFYQSKGFKVFGERKNYYTTPNKAFQDAHLMNWEK